MIMLQQERQVVSGVISIFADLFKYPDQHVWEACMSGGLLDDLKKAAIHLTGNPDCANEIKGFPAELGELQEIYLNSLGGPALPVESVYKIWTADSDCSMPFAKSKGYLLGDSALHIRYILTEFEMAISQDYENMPDHLAILLEMLAYFWDNCVPEFTYQFLEDHFDWLDELASALAALPEHSFYLAITRLLQQVLRAAKANLQEAF
ncbi:TorD/DmsD family molecular chaperone [Bacillus sp. B-jedd]|uniref:TorD/DmsD family molecular chaperone n=1 Tax=Bacillus sp. B-jedd TaxID=1476857 RepID=UPI0005156AAD|nr:molecular chaperone TorD family protein [Bacillus sp. B-jedd]CEG29346.1 Chaperone protein TorD [Bacillus sp. B-jedd]